MRLTLRTMLAYMDDILEPADHQDIGQKIEESEFATNLLHKIRDVTRQMRMSAPKVSGRGMGLDPNTVAEYLDNVLSGERVPDFEKVCLESNVHLAEVAACHQILSLVLGEPADIDPALRRRMYEIGSRSQETSDAEDGEDFVAPPRTDIEPPVPVALSGANGGVRAADSAESGDRVVPGRERLEVPDYLRSPRRSRFWPVAITALLAICLLVAIDMALFGWDNNPALKWLHGEKGQQTVARSDNAAGATGGTSDNGAATNAGTSPANPPPPGSPPAAPSSGTLAGGDSANASVPAAGSTPPLPPPLPPPLSAPLPAAGANTAAPGAEPNSAGPAPSSPPPGPGPVIGPAPANAIVSGPAASGPIAPPGAGPAGPGAPVPGGAPPGNAPPGGPPSAGDAGIGNTPPGPPPTGLNGAAPGGLRGNPKAMAKPAASFGPLSERLGRMISEQELLLRLPAGQTEWQRVSPGTTLGLKDRLLALPTFRPMITLTTGVSVQLMPETMIELDGYDPTGIPIVGVEYGRVVTMTAGKPDVKLKLILGDTAGTLTFFDPDAAAAIEVRHMLRTGIDPQTGPSRLLVALWATAGQIDWTGALGAAGASPSVAAGNGPLEVQNVGKLTAPSRIILAGSSNDLSGTSRELPRWLTNEPVSSFEANASLAVKEALTSGASVTVGLKELIEHRRAENRSLAARSMALIDEFDPFSALLNDPDQRFVWPVEIESLQAALGRGPATAGKVRAMFEKERGKDGDELYRMLWGYTKDQLQSGAAQALVDSLENDNLDYRVLSFYNLQKLVGKTHDYRPDAAPANRGQAARRWREDLKAGLIVPKGSAPSKTEASAAKTPDVPVESDAAQGLQPPLQPIPNDRPPSPITPAPTPPANLPPAPLPAPD